MSRQPNDYNQFLHQQKLERVALTERCKNFKQQLVATHREMMEEFDAHCKQIRRELLEAFQKVVRELDEANRAKIADLNVRLNQERLHRAGQSKANKRKHASNQLEEALESDTEKSATSYPKCSSPLTLSSKAKLSRKNAVLEYISNNKENIVPRLIKRRATSILGLHSEESNNKRVKLNIDEEELINSECEDLESTFILESSQESQVNEIESRERLESEQEDKETSLIVGRVVNQMVNEVERSIFEEEVRSKSDDEDEELLFVLNMIAKEDV